MIGQSLQAIQTQVLLQALAKWHRTPIRTDSLSLLDRDLPLSLLEKQASQLRDNVGQKIIMGEHQIQNFRKKVNVLEQQVQYDLNQGQTCLEQLNKILKSTQQQCLKRLQILEKERLQREIEIKTKLDEQIMAILGQNTVLQLEEQAYSEMEDRLDKVEDDLKPEQKSLQKEVGRVLKEMQQIRQNVKNRVLKVDRSMVTKTKEINNKIDIFEHKCKNWMQKLRQKRKSFEASLLQAVQKQIIELHRMAE